MKTFAWQTKIKKEKKSAKNKIEYKYMKKAIEVNKGGKKKAAAIKNEEVLNVNYEFACK
jgi:hypothetical protein